MSFDREDYKASLDARKKERNVSMLPMARLLAGAAPSMSTLTTDEHWNRYITMIQGLIDRTNGQLDTARSKLADPFVWKHEELAKLKADVLVAEAIVQTFTFAISLPSAILDGGDEARKMISEYEAKNEAA